MSVNPNETPVPDDLREASEHIENKTERQCDESQLKTMYLQQNKTEQAWEENKEKILEVLQAIDTDHKDPDHLLAQLYAEEEAFFEQVQRRKTRDVAPAWLEVATVIGFFGLAAAVLVKLAKR